MRNGLHCESSAKSSGCVGQPKGGLDQGVLGLISFSEDGGFAFGGTCLGYGALCLKPPGRSMVPNNDINTARPRVV